MISSWARCKVAVAGWMGGLEPTTVVKKEIGERMHIAERMHAGRHLTPRVRSEA